MNSKFKGHKKIKLIMSNQEINTKYEKQVGQNLMGSVESLERQVGSVGQPGMVYKSSISHSGCGIGSSKSSSSVDSEGKRREQLSLSLSPSLSHSERERGRERKRGLFLVKSSNLKSMNINSKGNKQIKVNESREAKSNGFG